jgi:hypothetical protein
MLRSVAIALLCLAATTQLLSGDESCGTFVSSIAGTSLNLAPPLGFVEICGQDAKLCQTLTSGYPPSSHTLGYFVTAEEWARYRKSPIGFSKFLIAQHAGSMSPDMLPDFKKYVRSQQGDIPDNTDLPSTLQSRGRAPIPVFEDAEDAIAFGSILKLRTATPAPARDITLATTNAALVVKGRVLSLYVGWDVTASDDAEPVKQQMKKWLNCLRWANRRQSGPGTP